MEKEKEDKRKKTKVVQTEGQPSEEPAPSDAQRIINEIVREAREGGGEDIFPASTEATDQLKMAFSGSTLCLPKFKQER